MQRRKHLLALIVVLVIALAGASMQAGAIAPGTSPFADTWARTDQPVASGAASRTWMWGPSGFSSAMYEPYTEAPDGWRVVQYYDKTRMEITHPNAVNDGVWYVTNGLLAKELITGNMQLGDNDFVNVGAAQVNIAGDSDDANGPTYASFSGLLNTLQGDPNATLTTRVHRDGTTADEPGLAGYNVHATQYVVETNHRIADPFWDFMNAQGTVYKDGQFVNENLFANSYYATGFPITDPYWARVKVGGAEKDVLVQAFERRVLTYTPDNAPEWRVEAGNVGQHYFKWRYNTDIPSEPPADAATDDSWDYPTPTFASADYDGQATFLIANQSPYAMTVRWDGATSQTMSIAACGDCIVYPSPASFPGCRNDTPYQTVTLPAGNYRVSVSWSNGNVTPTDGPWTIVPNVDYGICWSVYQQQASNSDGALRASSADSARCSEMSR